MQKIEYPLERVLEIKVKRVEDAERELKKRLEELENEKEKLKARCKERDEVKKHKNEKLAQLRHEMDFGDNPQKILQMKYYLKVVEERLEAKQKKVDEQQVEVKKAETKVEEARKVLRQKELEVDKLKMHKKDWIAIIKKELEIEEGRQMDELGGIIYSMRQRTGM